MAVIKFAVLRAGVLRGLFYVERLGSDLVVCGVPGSTPEPDGPAAFFV